MLHIARETNICDAHFDILLYGCFAINKKFDKKFDDTCIYYLTFICRR